MVSINISDILKKQKAPYILALGLVILPSYGCEQKKDQTTIQRAKSGKVIVKKQLSNVDTIDAKVIYKKKETHWDDDDSHTHYNITFGDGKIIVTEDDRKLFESYSQGQAVRLTYYKIFEVYLKDTNGDGKLEELTRFATEYKLDEVRPKK